MLKVSKTSRGILFGAKSNYACDGTACDGTALQVQTGVLPDSEVIFYLTVYISLSSGRLTHWTSFSVNTTGPVCVRLHYETFFSEIVPFKVVTYAVVWVLN